MQHLQVVSHTHGPYTLDQWLTSPSYKPDVPLRFVTEELMFESDAEAAQFILDYEGQHLLEDRQGTIVFLTGKAGQLFEGPKAAAFARVDIKGQI